MVTVNFAEAPSSDLASIDVAKLPMGYQVVDTAGTTWVLTASAAAVDHTTVEATPVTSLRWVKYTASNSTCVLTLVERKVITVETASVTFAGLSGDVDEVYVFDFDLIGGSTAVISDIIAWWPNGISTNMSNQRFYVNGTPNGGPTANAAGSGIVSVISDSPAATRRGHAHGLISARTGGTRICEFSYCGAGPVAGSHVMEKGVTYWEDTSTVITSMVFPNRGQAGDGVSATGNCFGVGSILRLMKYVTV